MGISSTNQQIHSATYNVKVKPDSSNICKVTYNYNGGSGSPKEDFVPIGTSIVLPTSTRSGYLFKGWFQSLTGSTMVGNARSRYTPKNSITLYALWIETYKIAFNANGSKETYNQKIVEDGEYVIWPEPTREHYYLVNWYKKITSDTGTITRPTVGKAGDRYKPDESCTLYANWSNRYTVTFDVNGGNTSIPQVQKEYGTFITLPTPTRTGYRFDAWYNKDGTKIGYAGTSYKVTSNITLYAHWKRELSASEMLNKFENSNYISDKEKKDTMLTIGRVMESAGYHPTFIIGMMGHIESEGNIGLFEKTNDTTYISMV